MDDAALGLGCFGDLVSILQGALQRFGAYTGSLDGDFGLGTQTAVTRFQQGATLPVTGRADPNTWEKATGFSWPALFDRCLQLTARFEGNGFGKIEGNFDGAGLTWGIIGFTLDGGEIRSIFQEVLARDASTVQTAFGANTDTLIGLFSRNVSSELMKFANSISTGPKKSLVMEPWRTSFRTFGTAPLVQQVQRDRARKEYFDPSQSAAADLGLQGDLGAALAFDIQVQDGGVKPASIRTYQSTVSDKTSNAERRTILATIVAASAKLEWRADVLARKQAIASGSGKVHGMHVELSNWGFGH